MAFLKFNKSELVNLEYSLRREIITANESGAYCNTSIVTCNTRRYHGLLAVPVEELGGGKYMLLSSLDETIQLGGKQFRADIIVYDRSAKPLMVVECKRPEVELTQEVLDQAVRYNMVLDVKYMLITNGTRTYICRKEGSRYAFISSAPKYNEMLCQQ